MTDSYPTTAEDSRWEDPDWWDEDEDLEPESRGWRRGFLLIVAILVVVSLAAGPVYNLLEARNPPVAQNGLEVCGFDYCVVQDAVRSAGLEQEAGRLSNLILTDDQAVDLAGSLVDYLGIEPVELTVVERLGGRLGGIYDPTFRSILVERPATAWVVSHEVAHAAAPGHDADFQEVLLDLVEFQSP